MNTFSTLNLVLLLHNTLHHTNSSPINLCYELKIKTSTISFTLRRDIKPILFATSVLLFCLILNRCSQGQRYFCQFQQSCEGNMATKKMIPVPYPFSMEEELKKNPKLKISDIEMLREWCEKQQHLPKPSDLHLIMFLHSNYYSIEAAKNTIENFFTIRSHVPEFFSNRDPLGSKELRQIFNVVFATELPGLSKQGHKILFAKLIDTDPSHYSFEDSCKYFFMESDLIGLRNGICDGYIFIGDSANVSLGHVGRINPMGMKKLVTYIQEGIPVRLKGIHFINTPSVMDVIINMAKPFMKKEFWNMIHLHSSLNTLEEFVSLDLLPNEIGGKAGSIIQMHENEIKEIDDKREWFIEEVKLSTVDESLRIGKNKIANDFFGVEGTFKKLEID